MAPAASTTGFFAPLRADAVNGRLRFFAPLRADAVNGRLRWWQVRRRTRRIIAAVVVLAVVALLLIPLLRDRYLGVTVRVVAAGNMACDPDDPNFLARTAAEGDHCRHEDASEAARRLRPDVVLGLGDYQFERPTGQAYRQVYGPSWGRLRDRTAPVYGNQEYKERGARSFVDYFGDRIGDTRGYWSRDVGDWHLVVLDSNCSAVEGGCAAGSPQQQWLAADLARTDKQCVLAAWHHPRWSSGIAGPDARVGDLYQTLYAHRVELVVSAHDADYERFGPLDPQGRPDPAGVRQFVAGTGGQAHYEPGEGDAAWRTKLTSPDSEFVDYHHHGVLELELRPGGWSWRFHALTPAGTNPPTTTADKGGARCT